MSEEMANTRSTDTRELYNVLNARVPIIVECVIGRKIFISLKFIKIAKIICIFSSLFII